MDRLTEEEILATWLKLCNKKDYSMSGVRSSQRYEAPLGYTFRLHYNTIGRAATWDWIDTQGYGWLDLEIWSPSQEIMHHSIGCTASESLRQTFLKLVEEIQVLLISSEHTVTLDRFLYVLQPPRGMWALWGEQVNSNSSVSSLIPLKDLSREWCIPISPLHLSS